MFGSCPRNGSMLVSKKRNMVQVHRESRPKPDSISDAGCAEEIGGATGKKGERYDTGYGVGCSNVSASAHAAPETGSPPTDDAPGYTSRSEVDGARDRFGSKRRCVTVRHSPLGTAVLRALAGACTPYRVTGLSSRSLPCFPVGSGAFKKLSNQCLESRLTAPLARHHLVIDAPGRPTGPEAGK